MKKRAKIIILIAIILILILVGIILMSFSLKKQEKSLSDFFPFLTNENNTQEQEAPIKGVTGTTQSSNGVSGGNSEGGTSSETTSSPSNNCFNQQISYSIRSFNQVIENNILNCSLILTNLDEGVTGEFEIRFTVEDNSQNEIYSESLKKIIPSKEEELFSKSFEISNQEIVCKYKTVNIPKKEIC